jgi:hypothetical protein
MASYVVAIPSYNRADVIASKTLQTLLDGGVPKNKIYIFVANKAQEKMYSEMVPKTMYSEIVVGKVGIAPQRKFISRYFPVNKYIVSVDDDVEDIQVLRGDKLARLGDIDGFFKKAYQKMKEEGLFIWGIYPVRNPFFMYKETTTDLRFLIGVMFGYINRRIKKLEPSPLSEGKEDYEQTILYYKMDGGVIRFNNVTTKTKFNAVGGLGSDRHLMNKKAAEYLEKTYPDIITVFQRKNGMTEVKLARLERLYF